jgi:transglutaminase-like putative cysteine protease
MRHRSRLDAAFLQSAVILGSVGIGLAGALAQDAGSEAPFAQQYESHIAVHADQTATEVVTQRFKVLTQGAVTTVSQQKLMFVAGVETLDTIEAYTSKAGGRKVPVSAGNILTQDGSPGLPATYFRDLKQRTIIFPDVGVGDTLVMTNRRDIVWKDLFSEFSHSLPLPRSAGLTSVNITVEAPASFGLRVKAQGSGVVETVDEQAGLRRHTIAITPAPYATDEVSAVSVLDRDPIVLMSTYKSFEDLGSAYGRQALPKASVTSEVTALANEITSGIAGQREQAIAIDAWMKKNIRYVAVYLTSGRLIPNEASVVLQNKFGDCKDKTTLMAALLAAKGIAAEPALINLGNAYTLAEPATFAALNHVILYLPEFDLYDDPTASLAAFGVLPFEAYDKPAVRVSTTGAMLARTPAMKPYDHTASSRTIVNIAADGAVTGRTEESNTGALAVLLRQGGAAVQSLGNAAAARQVLQRSLTPGAGQFDLGRFADVTDPTVITGTFTLDERFKPSAPDARIIVPRGMPLTAWQGGFLLGGRLGGRKSPFVCYAGRQAEDIEATFAPALPLPLPLAPVVIDNEAFTYQSATKVEGRTLKIHREFVSRVGRQVCEPELERTIAADLDKARINAFSVFAFATRPAPPRTVNVTNVANTVAQNLPARPDPVVGQNPPPVPPPPSAQNAPPAPPSTLELSRAAAAGQKVRLEFLYSLDPDCSSVGATVVRILEPPHHGRLMIENGQGFSNFAKDNQRYDCNARKSDGTYVFYQAEDGYEGKDSITLDIIFPSGLASKRHYAMDVR